MTSLTRKAAEIKQDIEELNSLMENATRQRSKDCLSLEIRKLQSELINLQNQIFTNEDKNISNPVPNAGATNKCYEVKLNNYAWDQSDKYIKLYVTLENVHKLPKEAVTCNFHDQSMDMHVHGLDNKNYVLPINNLCEVIDTEKSYFKVKPDMVIIYLSKKDDKFWSYVTSVEKILKDAKAVPKPTFNEGDDPSAGIMNIMKKMYEDGDDDMKRTIAKAWTESHDKRSGPVIPDIV